MIKSFCIKTNNKHILNYLLENIETTDLENIYLSENSFKNYSNIIVHYTGYDISRFQSLLAEILSITILKYCEKNILKSMIHSNYFYFSEIEKAQILEYCLESLLEEPQSQERENYVFTSCLKYIEEHKAMVLDGFVHFRLQEYTKVLDSIVDVAVNNFLIEREYLEFINLLKLYINSKKSDGPLVHLIYHNQESLLVDENKNIIPIKDDVFNAKYLSDISFSSNDYCLNTLLNLLPSKIEIHLIDKEDEFITTLQLIFEDKVNLCRDCNICKMYRTNKVLKGFASSRGSLRRKQLKKQGRNHAPLQM